MAQPARNLAPYKGKLIKLIHVAKRSLVLDDADYRAMLEGQTGKTSCSQMSMSELEKVVEHLRSRGFEELPGRKAKAEKQADDPQSKLIRHLWLKLHGLGAVKDSSEKALASFVKRQTHVERLEWLNGYQATTVIESLKCWVNRVEDTP
jgi:phage gp16-like protein